MKLSIGENLLPSDIRTDAMNYEAHLDAASAEVQQSLDGERIYQFPFIEVTDAELDHQLHNYAKNPWEPTKEDHERAKAIALAVKRLPYMEANPQPEHYLFDRHDGLILYALRVLGYKVQLLQPVHKGFDLDDKPDESRPSNGFNAEMDDEAQKVFNATLVSNAPYGMALRLAAEWDTDYEAAMHAIKQPESESIFETGITGSVLLTSLLRVYGRSIHDTYNPKVKHDIETARMIGRTASQYRELVSAHRPLVAEQLTGLANRAIHEVTERIV